MNENINISKFFADEYRDLQKENRILLEENARLGQMVKILSQKRKDVNKPAIVAWADVADSQAIECDDALFAMSEEEVIDLMNDNERLSDFAYSHSLVEVYSTIYNTVVEPIDGVKIAVKLGSALTPITSSVKDFDGTFDDGEMYIVKSKREIESIEEMAISVLKTRLEKYVKEEKEVLDDHEVEEEEEEKNG